MAKSMMPKRMIGILATSAALCALLTATDVSAAGRGGLVVVAAVVVGPPAAAATRALAEPILAAAEFTSAVAGSTALAATPLAAMP
jgi:hypothetical protein